MFAPKVKPEAKAAGQPKGSTPHDLETVLDEAGHSLDSETLGHFRSAFGHDFAKVRVHTGERAAASAASLSARAYTIGPHVVFGHREYAPRTDAGRRLLGHELAHVVQQSRGGPAAIVPGHRSLEGAADHAADQAVRGMSVQVAGTSAVGIACKTLFEELNGGRYSWALLKSALEGTRPVPDILNDLKPLGAYDRRDAIDNMIQERIARDRAQKNFLANQAAQTDPRLQGFADVQGRRVMNRIDDVLVGLRTGGPAASIPGLNFTPDDYVNLQVAGKGLTMAPDSSWFPVPLQQNLLKTLDLVLGPRLWPAATEGVNATDFFHGHLVVKKAAATASQVTKATAAAGKFERDLDKARDAAIGEVSYVKKKYLTAAKIPAYKKVVEQAEPSLGTLMDSAAKIPGAAVMYHTFEFNNPRDLKAKGQKRDSNDPRRHYVTPLDTNVPAQYTPPAGGTYEKEYTIIAPFTFLVDAAGAVHVRPMRVSSGLTTLELSTIAGTEYPPMEFE
jgi:Domain of unknown function (DUF4157)